MLSLGTLGDDIKSEEKIDSTNDVDVLGIELTISELSDEIHHEETVVAETKNTIEKLSILKTSIEEFGVNSTLINELDPENELVNHIPELEESDDESKIIIVDKLQALIDQIEGKVEAAEEGIIRKIRSKLASIYKWYPSKLSDMEDIKKRISNKSANIGDIEINAHNLNGYFEFIEKNKSINTILFGLNPFYKQIIDAMIDQGKNGTLEKDDSKRKALVKLCRQFHRSNIKVDKKGLLHYFNRVIGSVSNDDNSDNDLVHFFIPRNHDDTWVKEKFKLKDMKCKTGADYSKWLDLMIAMIRKSIEASKSEDIDHKGWLHQERPYHNKAKAADGDVKEDLMYISYCYWHMTGTYVELWMGNYRAASRAHYTLRRIDDLARKKLS